MTSQNTDEEIAAQVQRGARELFGTLVERYEQKLLRYGRKFLSNGEDVADLVQTIFVKAYTNIQSFDPALRFSPWIYRIAHNAFVNELKRTSRAPAVSFDFDTVFPSLFAKETADQSAQLRETRTMLDASLAQIDVKYREPLVLHYFEDLEYQEIADILRIPVSTVGVRLARGRALLRNVVATHHHGRN
ncbi:MAG: RNA polymerase sigma factor [Patescibacteria group bacterium]